MIRLRPFVLLGLLAVAGPLFLDGCASKSGTSGGVTATPPKPRAEERVAAAPVQEIPAPPEPAPVPLRSVEMAARNATGEQNIPFPDVLFDFDQYVLRDDALTAVEANAKRLKDNRITKVLLEGRCDEVGTSEYNLVLGERRITTRPPATRSTTSRSAPAAASPRSRRRRLTSAPPTSRCRPRN